MLPLVPVDVAPAPPELKQRAERLAWGLHPGLKAWIERQAREEAAYPHFDERRLRQSVARRFQSQGELSPAEADSLMLLVLKAAADVAEQDLRQAMASAVEIDEERRTSLAALAEFVTSRALLKPPPPERAHLRVLPPVSHERLEQLEQAVQSSAVRLQLATDRRSKVIAALFAVMKRAPLRQQPGLRRLT